MCSTAGLLTDRAEAAGPALVFALALAVLAAAPGAGELPTNADRLHHLEEAGTAAFAMLGQAPLEVLTGAQVVLGMLVGAIKVEHVHYHVFLLLGEGGGPHLRVLKHMNHDSQDQHSLPVRWCCETITPIFRRAPCWSRAMIPVVLSSYKRYPW